MAPVKRDPQVRIANEMRVQRKMRNPVHPFTLKVRPYQLQPFLIAPVLPGETLKSGLIQARALSDPLNTVTKLTGWWMESALFYVKHRDLGDATTYLTPGTTSYAVQNFVLQPDTVNLDSLRDADGNAWTYCYPNGVDWLLQCMQRIVGEYFRDPGEDWNTYAIDGVPQAGIRGLRQSDWAERLTLAANKRTDEEDFDVLGGTGELHPRAAMDMWSHWQTLRENGLMDMDYNNWIKTYGSGTREDEVSPNLHRPELLDHQRVFQFPTNVVGSNGVASSNLTFELKQRIDKSYRFNEPGFLVGLVWFRPKVYFINQEGSLSGSLDTVLDWLPAVLNENQEASYKMFDDTAGPLATVMTQDYWYDPRDLYLYGEQFTNFAIGAAAPGVTLPTVDGNRRYASTTDIDRFFAAASPANKILLDGVADIGILGHQRKHTDNVII